MSTNYYLPPLATQSKKYSDNHTIWFHDLIPVLPYFPETIALRTTTCLSRCGFTGYTVVEPAGFQLQSTFTCQYMPDRVAVQIRKHLFMPQNPQHIFPALFPVLSSTPLQLSARQLSHCFLVQNWLEAAWNVIKLTLGRLGPKITDGKSGLLIKLSVAKNCAFPLTVHVHTRRKSRLVSTSCRHNGEFSIDLFLTTLVLLKSAGLLPSASVEAGKGSFVPLFISHLFLPGGSQLISERGCESNAEQAQAGCLWHKSCWWGWWQLLEKARQIFRHSIKPMPTCFLCGVGEAVPFQEGNATVKNDQNAFLVESWETQVLFHGDKRATWSFGGKKSDTESSMSSRTPMLIWTSDNASTICIFIYL